MRDCSHELVPPVLSRVPSPFGRLTLFPQKVKSEATIYEVCEAKGLCIFSRREPDVLLHCTSTRSIYSATCTFHPSSFFIRSRSCDEAAGSPWTGLGRARFVPVRPQLLQHFRRIGVIAEVFKRGHLRANGHELGEDRHHEIR